MEKIQPTYCTPERLQGMVEQHERGWLPAVLDVRAAQDGDMADAAGAVLDTVHQQRGELLGMVAWQNENREIKGALDIYYSGSVDARKAMYLISDIMRNDKVKKPEPLVHIWTDWAIYQRQSGHEEALGRIAACIGYPVPTE
ncbi:hypothetical protein [Tumebacillus flagellatus]|uniref:Uncharacterized protein n=1 Tax=Tumebacillus flagellatus TaxID=1157490 RepID=A0A074LW24_9BACL|nr:hypothetical protein [Tumebacillus flagellatus]KEO84775.1 hypothetical protein EL26_01830 [Tumebacillus flagellatus]